MSTNQPSNVKPFSKAHNFIRKRRNKEFLLLGLKSLAIIGIAVFSSAFVFQKNAPESPSISSLNEQTDVLQVNTMFTEPESQENDPSLYEVSAEGFTSQEDVHKDAELMAAHIEVQEEILVELQSPKSTKSTITPRVNSKIAALIRATNPR